MSRPTPISTNSPGSSRRRPGTLPPFRPGRIPASRGFQSDLYRILHDTTKQPGSACHWLWSGGVNGGGYPIISLDGRVAYVSRFLYEADHGEPPGRLYSTCGVQLCVKPDHRMPKA
jgi:hypothetical protein